MPPFKPFPKSVAYLARAAKNIATRGSPFRKAAAIAAADRQRRDRQARVAASRGKFTVTKQSTLLDGWKDTPGGSKVMMNRTGASSSKSMGKIRTSRYRITKRQKSAKKGVEQTSERAHEATTTSQVLWIGHTSGANADAQFLMWRVIIKALFSKVGINIRNMFDDPLSSGYNLTAGDTIVVRFQAFDNALSTATYTLIAGITFDYFVSYFAGLTALQGQGVTLKSITYVPTVNAVGTTSDPPMARLDLEHCYVKYYAKSSMKIQNRSLNSAGSSENVDNVPLYGRSYGGSGNGAVQLGPANGANITQLIANPNTGYIKGTASDLGMNEPIHQFYFQYVTQKGKVHLDPGYVKTSVLYHKQNISLNRLNQILSTINSDVRVRNPFGKYRFFGLERMIDTSAVGSPASITVGVEINSYMNMSLYFRFPNATVPIFSRSNLT